MKQWGSRPRHPTSPGAPSDRSNEPLPATPDSQTDPPTPPSEPAFDGKTWLNHHVLRRFENAWFLGKITKATPPDDEDEDWSFHVIYADGDEEDLS